jgi:hypothetical protein
MLTMPLITMRLVVQERKPRTLENSSTRFRLEGYPVRPSTLWRLDGPPPAAVGHYC